MKLKINSKNLIYLLILLPFLKPAGLAYYTGVNTVFQVMKIISLIISSYLVFSKHPLIIEKCRARIYMSFMSFIGIYLFNSIHYESLNSDIINNSVSNIIILLLLHRVVNSTHREGFLKTLYWTCKVLICLQILSVFYVKSGHMIFESMEGDYTYLFGPDNYSAFAMIPMLGVIIYLGSIFEYKRVKRGDLAIGGALFISYAYTGSVTAATASLIVVIAILIYARWERISSWFTIKKILLFGGIFLILVLRFNVQNILADFIASVFNKGSKAISLNSRTYIWSSALKLIMKKPFLGYGNFTQETINSFVLYGTGHAHNIILELLLRTGVIGLALYTYFLIKSASVARSRGGANQSNILVITLVAFIILSFMDFYPLMQFQYFLIGLLTMSREIQNNSLESFR